MEKTVKALVIKKDYTGLKCEIDGEEKWYNINQFSNDKQNLINILSKIKKNQIIKIDLNNKNFINKITIDDTTSLSKPETIQVNNMIPPDIASISTSFNMENMINHLQTSVNITEEENLPNGNTAAITDNELVNRNILLENEKYGDNMLMAEIANRYKITVSKPDVQARIMDSCINRAVRIVTASDYTDGIPSSFIGIIINQCQDQNIDEIKNKIMDVIKSLTTDLFLFQVKEVPEYLKNLDTI